MSRRCDNIKIMCSKYCKIISGRHNLRTFVSSVIEKPPNKDKEKSSDRDQNKSGQNADTYKKDAEPPTSDLRRAKYLLAIHTGNHNPALKEIVQALVEAGYKVLQKTGRSLDAVEAVCRFMESIPLFNCGKGSALTRQKSVEMEASIMDGKTLNSGAVSGLSNIEHPVTLARMVMEKTPHICIAGHGSNKFAHSLGFPIIPMEFLITEEAEAAHKSDSVFYAGLGAAIALDPHGNLATGMTSGGSKRKLPGKFSSTASVGTGFYADNEIGAAVTTDSHGIMRTTMSHDIIKAIADGTPPLEAARQMLLKLQVQMYSNAGVMVVTKKGDVAIAMTMESMGWAFKRDDNYHSGSSEVLLEL